MFLVDEIDKPCGNALDSWRLSEEEVRKIGSTITQVIFSILEAEDELQAALLTGVCKYVTPGLAPVDNTLPVYFLSDEIFSKYYGTAAQEVETLVKKFCGSEGDAELTEKIMSDIKAKYNGYYQLSHSREYKEEASYCLFSVLNYIEHRDRREWLLWPYGGFLTDECTYSVLNGRKWSFQLFFTTRLFDTQSRETNKKYCRERKDICKNPKSGS